MSDGYKVMILSASAGTGHLRAAEAIAKACHADPRIGPVVNVDALTYTNKLFRDFYSKLYIQLAKNAPSVLGWWYDALDEPWQTAQMRLMLSRLNTRPLVKMIRDFNPDITICTHFLPAEIISHLTGREIIQTRLSIVVTDFDVHAMWLSRFFHHYFVAIEDARVHLQMVGMPADRITISGIPIDPVFMEKKERGALIEKHGLRPDLPMILVSAGALGIGSADAVVRMLSMLTHPAQVVVICGSNAELKEKIAAQAAALPNSAVIFRILGYTSEMDEWMKMATLFIGKPGGLTTAEALACGLPMVIYEPIPGQEERNSDHLLEYGIAIKCNQITTMAFKVDQLLGSPARLRRMAAATRRLAHPDAAATVVRTLLDQFRLNAVQLPKNRTLRRKSEGLID